MEVTAGGNTDHYATTGKPLGRIIRQDYSGISSLCRLMMNSSMKTVFLALQENRREKYVLVKWQDYMNA